MFPKTPFQYAVKKYGTNSFERTTLYIYDTEEQAYKKESELVDLDFIKLDYTYNACLGGIHYCMYKPLYQFDLEGNLKRSGNIQKKHTIFTIFQWRNLNMQFMTNIHYQIVFGLLQIKSILQNTVLNYQEVRLTYILKW